MDGGELLRVFNAAACSVVLVVSIIRSHKKRDRLDPEDRGQLIGLHMFLAVSVLASVESLHQQLPTGLRTFGVAGAVIVTGAGLFWAWRIRRQRKAERDG